MGKDSDSDSDSGPDDKGPAKKSAKTSGGSSSCTMGADGEPSWSLGNMKFVKVREFKGKTYIDIRELTWTNKQWRPNPARKAFLSIANSIRNSSQSYLKSTKNCPGVLAFIPSQRVPINLRRQLICKTQN